MLVRPVRLLEELEALLDGLGRDLLAWREVGRTSGTWSGAQLKTEADQRAHEHLVLGLGRLTPGVPVLSEEDVAGHDEPRPREYWLIDPIDGTASWAGGYAGFVTQAALLVDDFPELAVVRAPALRRTWSASRGGGATQDGTALVRRPVPGRRVLVDNYPEARGAAAAAMAGLGCTGYLESGSLGLKACLVASGEADVFVKDVVARDWDLAAPSLVVSEAGACFALLSGAAWPFTGPVEKAGGFVVAGTPEELAAVLRWHADLAGG